MYLAEAVVWPNPLCIKTGCCNQVEMSLFVQS
jgi:hypothetical protein